MLHIGSFVSALGSSDVINDERGVLADACCGSSGDVDDAIYMFGLAGWLACVAVKNHKLVAGWV